MTRLSAPTERSFIRGRTLCGLRPPGGLREIPEAIEQATLMLSANLLARAQSPKQVGSVLSRGRR